MDYKITYKHELGYSQFTMSLEVNWHDGTKYWDRCFSVGVTEDDDELRIDTSCCQSSAEFAEAYADGIKEAIKQARNFVEARKKQRRPANRNLGERNEQRRL